MRVWGEGRKEKAWCLRTYLLNSLKANYKVVTDKKGNDERTYRQKTKQGNLYNLNSKNNSTNAIASAIM
jgi:hypothetical protein